MISLERIASLTLTDLIETLNALSNIARSFFFV
jgi:hypothetical protein